MNKHSDDEYINSAPFQDESEITCQTVKLVKANKTHKCCGLDLEGTHNISVGERHYYEKARVDGSFWGSYRMCLTCLDKFIEGDY